MKKNLSFFLSLCMLLLAFMLVFTSCDNGATDLPNDSNPSADSSADTPSGENNADNSNLENDNFMYSKGLQYILNPDNTSYGVVGMGTCTDTVLRISPVLNGIPVTQIKYNAFQNCTQITSVELPESITMIGEYAFSGCTSLTSIVLPDSVTTLEKYAFSDCTALESVTLSKNLKMISSGLFDSCTSLRSISIPDSVTSIGDYSMYNCTSLAEVNLGENSSLVGIGNSSFSGCTGLISFTLPSKMWRIGSCAFQMCQKLIEVNNLSSIELTLESAENGYIGYYAKNIYTPTEGSSKIVKENGYIFYCDDVAEEYYLIGYKGNEAEISLPDRINEKTYGIYTYGMANLSHLTSITVPKHITDIGFGAFYGCVNVTEANIPTAVIGALAKDRLEKVVILGGDNIPTYAFNNVKTLTSITFEEEASIHTINDWAFNGCVNLKSITIPASVTALGNYIFNGCSALETLAVEDGNSVYIGINNCVIDVAARTVIAGCKNSTIPTDSNTVIGIGSNAFRGNANIRTITIPSQITFIGDSAFKDCVGLTEILIPANVKTIGNSAFEGCTALVNLTISNGVTTIGNYAFNTCSSLTTLSIPSSVTKIGEQAFHGCSKLIKTEGGVSYVDRWAIDCDDSVTSILLRNDTVGISDFAFFNSKKLTNVICGSSSQLLYIGVGSFANCEKLSSVVIPSTVQMIGARVMNGVPASCDVFYGGTASAWGSIIIDSDNADLQTASRYIYSATQTVGGWRYEGGVPQKW